MSIWTHEKSKKCNWCGRQSKNYKEGKITIVKNGKERKDRICLDCYYRETCRG